MLVDILNNPVVFNHVESLVNSMLEQEDYYINNYPSISNNPIFYSLTDKVNKDTCKLADVMAQHQIDGVFTYKITLIDDTMNAKFLEECMLAEFGRSIYTEIHNSKQFIIYTTEDKQNEVQSSIYRYNSQSGIISQINMLQRIKRPYIVGLYSWQDAHQLRKKISNH